MNIIKWTVVVVAGIISATAIGVTFLITNSVNTVLTPRIISRNIAKITHV